MILFWIGWMRFPSQISWGRRSSHSQRAQMPPEAAYAKGITQNWIQIFRYEFPERASGCRPCARPYMEDRLEAWRNRFPRVL